MFPWYKLICICKLILCNRGSGHIFSLIPFPGQVKIHDFYRSFHLSNLYSDQPRVLPPVISRILCLRTTSCKFLIGVILRHIILSLIGYIIIVLNFNCATWSLFLEHNFSTMSEAYVDLHHLIIPPWTTSLNPSLCRIHGSNSLRFIIPFAWWHRSSMASS